MQVQGNYEALLWVISTELFIFSYRHQLLDTNLRTEDILRPLQTWYLQLKMEVGCIQGAF